MYCPVGNDWVSWGGGAKRKYYWCLPSQFLPVLHELFHQLKLCVPITAPYLPGKPLVSGTVGEGTSLSFSPTTPLLQSCVGPFLPQSEKATTKCRIWPPLSISEISYFHYQKVLLKPGICHSGCPFKICQVCFRKNR